MKGLSRNEARLSISRLDRTLRDRYRRWKRWRGERSWSQFGEDLIIQALVGEGPGSFVDVGAGHPYWGSNSYKFYKSGWSGVLLEPNRSLATKLRRWRPKDRTINAAVGNREGETLLYEASAWQMSTTIPEWAMRMGVDIPERQSRVDCVTLGSLGLCANPRTASFLSIDTEGNDLAVLQGNDWDRYLPQVICVEQLMPWGEQIDGIADLLQDHGYRLEAVAIASSIYRHRDYKRVT